MALKLILGFALLSLIGACGYLGTQEQRLEKAAPTPQGRFIEVDGRKVHVVTQGSGPDLILIHGAGGSSRDFTFSMLDDLAAKYRVTMIDRPGHGFTERMEGFETTGESVAAQAYLVAKVSDRLDLKSAVVLGHSYGGAVALATAINHPDAVAGLVVLSGVSNVWEGDLDPFYNRTNTWFGRNVLIPVISAFASENKARSQVEAIFAPDPVPEGYLGHMSVELSTRPSLLRANTQQVGRLKGDIRPMVPKYAGLKIPVEIVHGTADETVPYDIHAVPLSGQIDGAKLTTLDGVGHMPQHAREEVVLAAIDRVAKRAGLR